jgi:hypothetical protein
LAIKTCPTINLKSYKLNWRQNTIVRMAVKVVPQTMKVMKNSKAKMTLTIMRISLRKRRSYLTKALS